MASRRYWLLAAVLVLGAAGSALTLSRIPESAPVPGDAVVLIDGVPHGRAEFDAFRESTRPFPSLPEAHRELHVFAEHLVLERERQRRLASSTTGGTMLPAEDAELSQVSEADVEAYYREHRDRFVRPRRVRVAYFRADRTPDIDADALRIAAVYVRAQMAQSEAAFAALLGEQTEGLSAGELEPFACTEEHPLLPDSAVVQACALALGALGTPVAGQSGHFLIRKLGDHPAVHRPLERVAREIRRELASTARNAAHAAKRRHVLDDAEIVIPTQALAALVEPPVRNVQPSGPPRAPGRS